MLKTGDLVVANCSPEKLKSFMNGHTFSIRKKNPFWNEGKQEYAYFLLWSKENNGDKSVPVSSPGKEHLNEKRRIANLGFFFWYESELIPAYVPPVQNGALHTDLPLF